MVVTVIIFTDAPGLLWNYCSLVISFFLFFFCLSVYLSIHPTNHLSCVCTMVSREIGNRINSMYIYIYPDIPCLIALFIVLRRYCSFFCFVFCFCFFFLNKLNVVANLCQASLLVPFFFSFFWWGVAGCTCSIWKLPRQGFNWRPMPQQHGIQAMSVIYTTAHNNARSPAHRVRPGIEYASSWTVVGFVTCWATRGTSSLWHFSNST